MATLHLSCGANGARSAHAVSLRQWLDGRWALLFSHPDDFAQCDFELDRWLQIVGAAFARARIRPLALARASRLVDRGWVSQLTGGACLVSLHEPADDAHLVDLHAHRLESAIAQTPQRFAMLIDAALRRRFTCTYAPAERPPSPLTLVRVAARVQAEPPPPRPASNRQALRIEPPQRRPYAS
jgi:alkyl hydroperoxide reductase subunit AhpC